MQSGIKVFYCLAMSLSMFPKEAAQANKKKNKNKQRRRFNRDYLEIA